MIFDNPMYDWIAVGALANLAYWIVLAFTRTATRTAEAASDRSRGAGRARVEPEFDADDGYDEPYQAAAPEPEPVDPIVRAHAVLGLLPGASSVEIKAAFRRRVSQCHPDKVSAMSDAIKAAAHTDFIAIKAAYDVLEKAGLVGD